MAGSEEHGQECNDIIQLNADSMEYEPLPGTLETPRHWIGMTVLMDTEDG